MTLRVQDGGRSYWLDAPDGSQVVPMANGRSALSVPGSTPDETCFWLPIPKALAAASEGRYGLRLRGEG